LSEYVSATQIRNLSVLTSGDCEVSPASLLLRMPAVMEQMRREYDLIVVDAPPLMHLADARLLGRLSDGMILVFRSKVTASEVVRSIRKRLSEDGTKILGTILNDWDASSHQQKYGYYYMAAASAGGSPSGGGDGSGRS
jgi:Mrp family chromosome partitioning ATPase